jgi:O-antigen/teichoic acid export membrane protein
MTDSFDLQIIKNRAVKGIIALTSRTFLLQIFSLLATFLLTVFLSPKEYGIFFVVSAVVNFLVYFSDIGLAAALIQKKEDITGDDLKTTFTIQQLLVLSLTILALLFSPSIASFYNLSLTGLWLFRALVFSFFLSSLKTIPSIILERKLHFTKLVIPQIIENLFFYITAVILAWQGWGIASFTWAVLLRGVSGLIVIYLLAPWKPAIGIVRKSAKKLLSFGIPFQLNSLLDLVKDDLLTVFLGKILTFTQIGFIGWAQKWAYFPLRFFMDSINRVTFPAYSRIQHERKILGQAIEKSIYFISLTIFPTLTGLFLSAPYFVAFFPKYEKWQPALLSLAFFCVNAIFASISTTLTNAFNATGKIRTTLNLMIFWTSSTWILTVLFIKLFGYNGVALASACVAATSWITVYLAKRIIDFSFWANIKDALVATAIIAFSFFLIAPYVVKNLLALIIIVLVHIGIYLGLVSLMGKEKLVKEIKIIFNKKIRN